MNEYEKQMMAVLDDPGLPESQLIELSNGIVLRPKKIPILLIQKIQRELRPPIPPKVYLESKQREEYNYEDPAYKAEVEEYETAVADSYINVFAAYGTEIEFVPDEIPGLEDSQWVEDFQPLFDEPIPDRGKTRYLTWLQCVALVTPEDIQRLAFAVRELMGVTEEAVAETLEKFPSKS